MYVDDVLITGFTKTHCELRQRLFRNTMKAMGKKLSTKGDTSVKEHGLIVGMKVTAAGIEPDDGVIEALKVELSSKPSSMKDARRLIGIILYSSGAFEWSAEDPTWWAQVINHYPMPYLKHSCAGHLNVKTAWRNLGQE